MNKWMKSQCSERKIDSDNSSLDIYSDLNISKDQDNPQSPDNDTALEKPIQIKKEDQQLTKEEQEQEAQKIEEMKKNIKPLDEMQQPFKMVNKMAILQRSLLKTSKMFKKIKRLDTFGTEIKKGGVKHSITFNENVKIDIVENWKELNVIPKDWNQKKKCCKCVIF